MREVKKCERHSQEMVVGKCSQCGRDICRICRQSYGYFCSETCRQALRQRTQEIAKPEEREELAAIDRKVERGMRVVTRVVLPGLLAVILLFVVLKVTSKAGKIVWEFKPSEDRPLSPLTMARGNIYVGCDDGILYCLDKRDGARKWTFKTEKELSGAKPIVVEPGVCITWDTANMYGVDAEKGSRLWQQPLPGQIKKGPVARGSSVYFVQDFYQELSREQVREMRRSGDTFAGAFFSAVSRGEGDALRIKTASSLYALDARDGQELWTREIPKGASPGYLTPGKGSLYLSLHGAQGGGEEGSAPGAGCRPGER